MSPVWIEFKQVSVVYYALPTIAPDDAVEAQNWRKCRMKWEKMRNQLVEHYMPIVRYNAERVHVKLPAEVEVDDLMSSGIFGLMDAIKAFDMNRGVKFETYCAPRIRGAILDELRSMDWVPRLVRSRTNKMDIVVKMLENELGHTPSHEEIRNKMGITLAEFEKIRKDSAAVGVVSLSRKWFETDSNKDICEIDVLEDRRAKSPDQAVMRSDLKELITRGLSRAERLIIALYYFEEMTMREIGETLDLSESRVSQMHSNIMIRLKASLTHKHHIKTVALNLGEESIKKLQGALKKRVLS